AALLLNHAFATKLGLVCASIAPSTESLYHAPLRLKGGVAIAISQSGASPDIVAMQQAARRAGAFTVALVNDAQSPLAREADALEAALKLKETAAIHAEGFSSAEVLHGPAGIVGRNFPVLGFAPTDAARSGFFETMDRLASFGASPALVDVEPHGLWPTLVV